ncbi:MAG: tyrosine-protein phosphatase [Myxococcota bacterium]|nr:tyrosine-protein phosphatase [Myxococcota bacterium]
MSVRRRLAALATLLLLGAGAGVAAAVSTGRAGDAGLPEVDRLSDTKLQILWSEGFATGAVHVYAGHAPEGIDRSEPVAVATGGALTLRAAPGETQLGLRSRLFFELVPEASGDPVVTAERRLPLDGADNFRDLGGYATADGRRVRWGRLYRSNDLSGLSASDRRYLSRIGVRLVCDFRTDREREDKPDRVEPSEALELLDLPVEQRGVDAGVMARRILTGGIAELGMEQTMRDAYRAFVVEHAETWAALLRRLARPGSLPALVHCTAGKDRTGFASALVLLTLGVPRETVFADYLLTNHYRERFQRLVMRWAPVVSLFRTRADDVRPLLEARRAYLETSLDAMEELHGSVDGYLEKALGVDASLRAALERNLLR